MEGGYTPLNLGVLLGLNNYYAQRFYELLRLWSGTKTKVNYTVEHIRDCLQLKDKYPNFAHLKAKVLDPSIKALNDSECFKITYKEIKEGRKVVSIDFIVEDLETRTYYLDQSQVVKDTLETKAQLSEIPGIDEKSEIVEHTPISISEVSTMDFDKLDLDEMKKPVQRLFKKDFKDYDFSIKYIRESLDFAISVVMEKDDVEILGTRQYPLFKKIFLAMVAKGEKLDLDEFASSIENEMFW
ncbi:MAG: hypothetical protein ACRC3Y_00845, partial [Romboutsia sp.]|uniref:hypothetical protein n=1 Tax=Romboutsia sp. TaxID=1965302 RepID=UPI003F3888A7